MIMCNLLAALIVHTFFISNKAALPKFSTPTAFFLFTFCISAAAVMSAISCKVSASNTLHCCCNSYRNPRLSPAKTALPRPKIHCKRGAESPVETSVSLTLQKRFTCPARHLSDFADKLQMPLHHIFLTFQTWLTCLGLRLLP